MKITTMFVTGLLALSLLVPSAQADRRWRRGRGGIGAAVALGAIAGIAATSDRGYYSPYRSYPYVYNSPVYASPIYGSSYYVPPTQVDSYPGAYSYVDEGAYRNYRDINGNYIGRVPLGAIYR